MQISNMSCCGRLLALAAVLLAVTAHAAVLEPASHRPLSKLPFPRRPFAGNGTCGEPVHDKESGTTTVQCLGPKHLLSPGQTIDTMMLLETPYPKDRLVVMLNTTSQMVDDNLRPVPLSEVYVHHYGSNFAFIQGSGAELRGSFSRPPLPEPYAFIVNGTDVAQAAMRMTNIQLINTLGIPEHQAKPCLECWCEHDPFHPVDVTRDPNYPLTGPHHDKGDPTHNDTRPGSLRGSLVCCHQCPSEHPMEGPYGYHLQYTVTYRELSDDEQPKEITFVGFDAVGLGNFEYDLTEAKGPGSTHVQSMEYVFDERCPQKHPVEVVRCIGHQHFGGACMELFDLDKNKTICRTCPTFGTRKGVPGDEEGYVVRIPDDDLAIEGRTYTVEPGTRVRISSTYDASVPRFGIMGIQAALVAGMEGHCHNTFGGEEPDSNLAYAVGAGEEYNVPLYGIMGNHQGFVSTTPFA